MNAIYVHIPFCVKKCSYCDFNSYAGLEFMMPAYFETLNAEIIRSAESTENKNEIETIYIGGGTPSLPDPEFISGIIKNINSSFVIADDAEITMESNPCSISAESLRIYRKAGVNRLSMGLQSADNRLLKVIGRSHDFKTFLEAFAAARQNGFQNINVDLMFGIPGQTLEVWAQTLREVCGLQPEHISAYSLTVDESTPIAEQIRNGKLTPTDDGTDREMYHLAVDFLNFNGFARYEISNFAKPGCESRHNLNYWNNGEYLGFGAGAHSYANRTRWHNIPDPEGYCSALSEGSSMKRSITSVSDDDFMAEYTFLKLRLIAGIDLTEFEKLFRKSIYEIHGEPIRKFIEESLLIEQNGYLKLTDKGLDLANIVMSELI